MAETAIILPVPEAGPLIEQFRRQYTEDGAQGVPPHVTLLYPFADTSQLVAEHVSRVAGVIGAFGAFDFSLASVACFPGPPRVLYLQPVPDAPFRELTRALVAAFPEHRPYGGDHPDPTPHVTVAIADDPVLAEIEQAVVPLLPIRARAVEASLLEHDDEQSVWRLRGRFPLG